MEKLTNPPLNEVIFELFWELTTSPNGLRSDPGFEFAKGILSKELEPRFPVSKMVVSELIRILHKPSVQHWAGELTWPVVQHGEGVMTVNDTKNTYSWDQTFRSNIEFALDALLKSYKKAKPLKFNKITLQYMNVADKTEDIATSEFIRKSLLTEVKTSYELPGAEFGIAIAQTRRLPNGSNLHFSIQTAINNLTKKEAIAWVIRAEFSGPIKRSEILPWLDSAHEACSKVFVKTSNPEFYASFV